MTTTYVQEKNFLTDSVKILDIEYHKNIRFVALTDSIPKEGQKEILDIFSANGDGTINLNKIETTQILKCSSLSNNMFQLKTEYGVYIVYVVDYNVDSIINVLFSYKNKLPIEGQDYTACILKIQNGETITNRFNVDKVLEVYDYTTLQKVITKDNDFWLVIL